MPADVIPGMSDQTFFFHSDAIGASVDTYSFTIVQDSLVEYDEEFAFAFSSTDTYVVLAETHIIFFIANDDRKC